MKRIRFTYPHHTGGYGCSEPGDNSGEYVRAGVAAELVEACDSAQDVADALLVERDDLQKRLDAAMRFVPTLEQAEAILSDESSPEDYAEVAKRVLWLRGKK